MEERSFATTAATCSYKKGRPLVEQRPLDDSQRRGNHGGFARVVSSYDAQPLIAEKLPVSISLGLWILIVSYSVSIPLGIAKAMRDGSRFDIWTSAVISIGYAIPSFVLAIFLIIFFAGSSFWNFDRTN